MDFSILEKAFLNFKKNTGYEVEWERNGFGKTDTGDIKINLKINENKVITRFAEIKKEIRKHHVPQIQQRYETIGPVMLVAERLYPNIKTLLNEAGIDWIDAAGNIRLKDNDILIWIDHHTTTPVQTRINRAFTKTGLKVVFLFLHNEAWLNRTYREIAEAADVALGNIKHVLDGLKEHDFILAKSKNILQLKNREKLLDQWITAFTDELKPRILKGRYGFINREAEQNWKKLRLGTGTMWGGEPAADRLTNDLKPLEFILYTQKGRAALMKEFKMVPDNEGNIEVREPYWTIEPDHPDTAPLLTIYTDLMETGDPRNMNIAKQLYAKTAEH